MPMPGMLFFYPTFGMHFQTVIWRPVGPVGVYLFFLTRFNRFLPNRVGLNNWGLLSCTSCTTLTNVPHHLRKQVKTSSVAQACSARGVNKYNAFSSQNPGGSFMWDDPPQFITPAIFFSKDRCWLDAHV